MENVKFWFRRKGLLLDVTDEGIAAVALKGEGASLTIRVRISRYFRTQCLRLTARAAEDGRDEASVRAAVPRERRPVRSGHAPCPHHGVQVRVRTYPCARRCECVAVAVLCLRL